MVGALPGPGLRAPTVYVVTGVQLAFGEPSGQGLDQLGELAIAFVLSLLIGL